MSLRQMQNAMNRALLRNSKAAFAAFRKAEKATQRDNAKAAKAMPKGATTKPPTDKVEIYLAEYPERLAEYRRRKAEARANAIARRKAEMQTHGTTK